MVLGVPAGKEVTFNVKGGLIKGLENTKLILTEAVTLSFTSDFSELVNVEPPKMLLATSQFLTQRGVDWASKFSGQYQQLGFQTWTGTKPVQTSFSIALHMKTDAKKDVIDPVLILTKLALPSVGSAGELIAPGPSIESAFDDSKKSVSTGAESDVEVNAVTTEIPSYNKISCWIGRFYLDNVVIRRVQPTFSREIDDKGYPIFATVEIEVHSILTATTAMIDNMLAERPSI